MVSSSANAFLRTNSCGQQTHDHSSSRTFFLRTFASSYLCLPVNSTIRFNKRGSSRWSWTCRNGRASSTVTQRLGTRHLTSLRSAKAGRINSISCGSLRFFALIGQSECLSISDKCDSIDRGALRVFVDDTDPAGSFGGEGYSYYGVGSEGALVVVRPDGYVGAIAPLDHVKVIDSYFASFMKIPA